MVTSVVPPSGTAGTTVGQGPLRVREFARTEDGERLHALLWEAGPGWRMISSAVLGGGMGERAWVLNAQVSHGYRRTDPDRHLADLAERLGAGGPGVGLMTAADVRAFGTGHDHGVDVVATAGLGVRGWAAVPDDLDVPGGPGEEGGAGGTGDGGEAGRGASGPPPPGTVNIVAALPVALTDAALVNAVATATEAKVQALLDAGYDCSGTPTDAVCVAARVPGRDPGAETHAFAGPRSLWGARLARAVHRAVGEAARRQGRTP